MPTATPANSAPAGPTGPPLPNPHATRSRRPLVPFPVRIAGTGVYRPSMVVESAELDARFGRAPGTTVALSGVRSRRWASPHETSTVMGAAALRDAIAAAELQVDDLDAVIVASVLPEQPMPTNAVLVLRKLGLVNGRAEGFDVNTSCLGFLTALQVASLGVAAGQWNAVGVVATEVASKGLNHTKVEASALFGDGAGAAVVTRSGPRDDARILGLRFATWPEGADLCRIDAGGTRWNSVTPPPDPSAFLFRMDGRGVLQHAAARMPTFLAEFFADLGMTPRDIDVVIPHQASGVGMRYLREKLDFPPERVIDLVADHGNQVSASIPNALHAAVTSGRLRRGGTALVLGTGAGLTVGAAVLTF